MEIFHQIKSDPLRTVLSLAGVSVGIFVVVVSFALVDAFRSAVVAGFDHFGSDMIMVERFPVESGDGADDNWSRYASRPMPSREDYLALASYGAPLTNDFGWAALAGESEADVTYCGKTLYESKLVGVCGEWQHLVYSSVCEGRSFSQAELSGHDAKVILGSKVAQELFGAGAPGDQAIDRSTPCGQSVRIAGKDMTVIGILSHEGKNIINLYATDYAVVVPFDMAQQLCGKGALQTMIAVGPGAGGCDAALQQVRRLLRASRRLHPVQDDNFALNTMEDLCRQTVALTSKITAAGMLVAIFSLLIGGFGIVNIMLVSVKERTWIIGLKKALGARRRRIMMEFLLEALLLSVLGAAAGVLLAWGATALIPADILHVRLTAAHAALAAGVAIILGLASGLAPASQASRLDPVVALRG